MLVFAQTERSSLFDYAYIWTKKTTSRQAVKYAYLVVCVILLACCSMPANAGQSILESDGIANFKDFAVVADHWLQPCNEPNWCGGSDFDVSGEVNLVDLEFLADCWLSDICELLYLDCFTTTGSVKALALADNLLLVGTGTALVSVDISTPSNPGTLDQIVLSDIITDIEIRGDIAYVAADDQGLFIVDISDPCNLSELGSCPAVGAFLDLDVVDNYVYVADHAEKLIIIDASDPCSPEYVRTVLLASYGHGVAASGDGRVYLSSGNSSKGCLTVVNATNPQQAAKEGETCLLAPYPVQSNTAYHNNFAYVLSPNKLEIVDVTASSSPYIASFVEIDHGYDIRIDGDSNTAFIASKGEGLVLVDVTDPANPLKLTAYTLLGDGYSLDTDDTLVCIGLFSGQVQIFRKVCW